MRKTIRKTTYSLNSFSFSCRKLVLMFIMCLPFAATSQNLDFGTIGQNLTSKNVFKDPNYFNWGGSILRTSDGVYHLFYARWHRKYSFYGWLTHSEVAHATASSPTGPWKYISTELKGRGAPHWDAVMSHNPKIKYFNGKYYLYYISTNLGTKTFPEKDRLAVLEKRNQHPLWKEQLRPNQRTGVAVSNSIYGPWERSDVPLIQPSPPIETLTVNPAACQGKDGRFYLIVKGDKKGSTSFERNQAIAISNKPSGPFAMQPKPVIDYMDTEDMSLWYNPSNQQYYGVYHAHHYIGLVRSPNGTDWKPNSPKKLIEKKNLRIDGKLILPNRMERPFVYTEEGKAKVLSVSVKKGEAVSYNVYIPLP